MKKIAVVVLLFLSAVACSDPTLQKVSKGMDDYATAVRGVSMSVLQAQQQGVLTVEQARPVVVLLLKLNEAGKQASALTRNFTALPAASKGQLSAVLGPVIQSLQEAVSSGLTGLPDNVRQSLLLGLNSALLALNSIQPLLTSSNERRFQWDSQLSYNC